MAVRLVVDRISSECSRVGVEVTEIETEEVDGLPCSLIVRLRGKDMDQLIDHWIGTICWVCKSPFRPLHKRKNWFVEVKTYHPGKKEKVLDVKDVYFQTMRSSGAGGQHGGEPGNRGQGPGAAVCRGEGALRGDHSRRWPRGLDHRPARPHPRCSWPLTACQPIAGCAS